MSQSGYDTSQIEVLTAIEAVRRRSAMYVGPLDAADLPVRLLQQALCHAADCAADGGQVRASIVTSGRSAQVSYDAGLPLQVHSEHRDIVARLFLTLHSGCRNLKKHIEVGEQLCQLGLTVLNAMCAQLEVRTCWRGLSATYVFAEGRELENGACVPTAERDQTQLRFHLDTKILHDNVWFEPTAIRAMARQVESLLPTLSIEVHAT